MGRVSVSGVSCRSRLGRRGEAKQVFTIRLVYSTNCTLQLHSTDQMFTAPDLPGGVGRAQSKARNHSSKGKRPRAVQKIPHVPQNLHSVSTSKAESKTYIAPITANTAPRSCGPVRSAPPHSQPSPRTSSVSRPSPRQPSPPTAAPPPPGCEPRPSTRTRQTASARP